MEIAIITFIIFLFVFLNSLVYIAGSLATPAGMVFLGTVHWPGDYFYYLSQFAQGATNWFTSSNLYTNDFPQKIWVGWVNVFLGRIFSLLGINHLLSYQLSIVLFTVTFLGLSYMLIREIFPDGKKERIIAFLLFTTSNAFPKLVLEGDKWSLSYYDFWFNIGIPFNRLGGVPHHLIARSVIVLSILLFVWFIRKKGRRWIFLIGLLFAGFVLGSIDPVQWGIVIVVLCIVAFIKHQARISNFLPSLLFVSGGLPIVLYLKNLFTVPPFSQLAVWEATQQLHPGIIPFILGNGPVMILALTGVFFFIRKATLIRLLGVVFTVLTISLYFSPVAEMLGVVNVRFLPPVTTLFLASLATEAIILFSKKFKKRENYVLFSILFFILLLSLPAYRIEIQTRTTPDTKNGFFYIPQDAYRAYMYAAKISTTDDTFLVMWPFNWSFPAVTGRRVFAGHSLLTTDFAKKEKESFLFFDGKLSEQEAQEYLTKNKIDFVITYPWAPKINTYPFLERVRNEGYLAVYRVK